MATGRSISRYTRAYVNGFDMSGFSRSIGPLAQTFGEEEGTTFSDGVIGARPGQAKVSVGTLTGNFDNTPTSGLHDVLKTAGGSVRTIMVPQGIRAAPVEGDPVFCSQNPQLDYIAVPTAGELISVTIPFGAWAADADTLAYNRPWGDLLHENKAETAVNSSVAVVDNAASSALGGYMMYQFFTSDGTATLIVEDASTNTDPSFSTLVSSGVIDASATPVSAIVPLAVTATVERYLRWQIVLGTATTVTFATAFVRGN